MPDRPALDRRSTATLVPTTTTNRLAVSTHTRGRVSRSPSAPDNTPDALLVRLVVGGPRADLQGVAAADGPVVQLPAAAAQAHMVELDRAGAQHLHQQLGRALDRAGVPTLAVNVEDLDAADAAAYTTARAAGVGEGLQQAARDLNAGEATPDLIDAAAVCIAEALRHGLVSADLHEAAVHYVTTRPGAPRESRVASAEPPSAAAWDDTPPPTELGNPTPVADHPSTWSHSGLLSVLAALVTHGDDAMHRLGTLVAARAALGLATPTAEVLDAARYLTNGLLPDEVMDDTTTEEGPRG